MPLTSRDLKQISDVVERKLEEKLEEKLEQKLEEKLDEKLEEKFSQFKDELYTKIDPVLEEVMANRDERTIISHHVSDHGDRLDDHEKRIQRLETSQS